MRGAIFRENFACIYVYSGKILHLKITPHVKLKVADSFRSLTLTRSTDFGIEHFTRTGYNIL